MVGRVKGLVCVSVGCLADSSGVNEAELGYYTDV